MFELARRNDIALPYPDVESVKRAYVFSDLQSFLDIYYQACAVLVQEVDFFDLTMAYLQRAHSQGVRHAEIFFDPQTHTARGVAMGTVIEGIQRALTQGEQELSITSELILCFLRHLPQTEAMSTLDAALPYLDHLSGVGLDSGEVGNPPVKFKDVYDARARRGCGPSRTRGGGPARVHLAGARCSPRRARRPRRALRRGRSLVDRLAADRVPLTVCPLSNVRLRVVDTLADHPLPRLLERGLCTTVNSDDPAYFGGYVGDNFEAIQASLPLSDEHILQLRAQQLRGVVPRRGDQGELPVGSRPVLNPGNSPCETRRDAVSSRSPPGRRVEGRRVRGCVPRGLDADAGDGRRRSSALVLEPRRRKRRVLQRDHGDGPPRRVGLGTPGAPDPEWRPAGLDARRRRAASRGDRKAPAPAAVVAHAGPGPRERADGRRRPRAHDVHGRHDVADRGQVPRLRRGIRGGLREVNRARGRPRRTHRSSGSRPGSNRRSVRMSVGR